MSGKCVVFVCNLAYFPKFIKTYTELTTVGKYSGDVCLVIGNDLINNPILETIQYRNIIIKHFPDIVFPDNVIYTQRQIARPSHWFNKLFQYHKFHLFNKYFKRWEFIFYIDCGVTILSDIQPMLDTCKKGRLLAHSDSYPEYNRTLSGQFSYEHPLHIRLEMLYNLNIDYFQSTIMIYDTNIIENATFNDLYTLMCEFPISITNDQGIFSLYFTNIIPCFEQIPIQNKDIHFYDYLSRRHDYKYIMLKCI